MLSQVSLAVCAAFLAGQSEDWIAAGNRALDNGSAEEAAADFAHALEVEVRAGAPVTDLLQLRVTLATAYLEAGSYRDMETVLNAAQKTAWQLNDATSRAELLNAWSALHLKQGKLAAAETELQEAYRTIAHTSQPGDFLPSVLHNLAGIEMRLGKYPEALGHEQEAMRAWEQMSPNPRTLIRVWASLASLQYLMGRPGDAHASLERALRTAEKMYGPEHPLVADLLESHAVVLDKLKLKREARRARYRARTIRRTADPAGADRLTRDVREALSPEKGVYLRSK